MGARRRRAAVLTGGLVVDLFAGPGGFDLGAGALGLDPIGFELDRDACATRAAAGLRTVRADVSTLDTAPMAGRLDGLLASPPCTTYSAAGKRAGERDKPLAWEVLAGLARGQDRRHELSARAESPTSLLVVEPLRFTLACRPRWAVWEQVPPVLEIWETCASYLRDAGYSTWCGILNAANFGVPQTRRRAFLIARLDGVAGPPAPTHSRHGTKEDMFGPGLARWVSMGEALGLDAVVDDGHSGHAPLFATGDGPSRTVVKSTRSWTVLDEPARTVCGNRAPRWAYGEGEGGYRAGRTLHTHSGNGDAHDYVRDEDEPGPTVTGRAGRWELVNGNQANACRRGLDEPAGTLFFGGRSNWVAWELHTNRGQEEDGSRQVVGGDRPAPTLTGKSGGQWELRPSACWPNDRTAPRTLDDPAPTVAFGHNAASWVLTRPATTVMGDPRPGRPGHEDREGGEGRYERDSVQITTEQAAVLQGFPAGYPWRGSRTARFRQVGNAVPPPLAARVVAAASGRPVPPR